MLKIENTEVLGWEHAIHGMRNPMNSWANSDSSWRYVAPAQREGHILASYSDDSEFWIGPNDANLMNRLRNAGTDHRKFMRMITVYVDLIGPLYWWKEFDTYKVGTVANSCSTMHKITSKEFTLDDFSCEHLFDSVNGEDTDCWIRSGDISGVLEPINVLDVTIMMLNKARILYLYYQKKALNGDQFAKDHVKEYWWQMIQLLPSSYNQRRTVMLNYEVLANIYKSRRNHKLDEWHTFCDWIEGLPYSELITGIDWKKANPILHAERDENGNLLREMQKVIDPTERLSDTSKAVTDIMDKLIASRGKRSEIPGIIEDNIGCNEGLNKHFGGCEE